MDPMGYEALKHFGFLELLGHGDHQEIKGGLARSEIFVCGRIHKCKVPSAARAPAGSMSWKMTANHCELPFSTMMRMTDNILLYMIYKKDIYIYMYIFMDSCKDWPKNRSQLGSPNAVQCSFSNPVAIQRCVRYFMSMFNVFCWDA